MRFKILVVCLLLAGVVAAVAFWILGTKAPVIRLSDGSILALEFVSYEQQNPPVRRLSWVGAVQAWLAQKQGRPTSPVDRFETIASFTGFRVVKGHG